MLFRPFPSTAIIIVAIIIVAIIKAQLNPRQGRKYRLVRLVHLNSSLPPLARGAGGQGGRGGVAHGQGAHLVVQMGGMWIRGGKIIWCLYLHFLHVSELRFGVLATFVILNNNEVMLTVDVVDKVDT